MKNFKKIASAIAALSLAACMVAPVATMTSFAVDNNSVIITTNSNGTHTYGLYQIFDGELSDGSLINIEWGAAFDGDGETFLTNLKADGTLGSVFGSCNSAKDVADVLGSDANKGEDSTVAKQFADFTGKWLKTNSKTATYTSTASGENTVTVAGVADGYYLVQDESSPDAVDGEENAGAMTRFVLQVIGDTSLSVTTKQTAPSVDKLVLDESADAESSATAATESGLTGGKWGETADHNINETFQFKLKATIPNSDEIDEYKSYKLVFHDTWSTGVSYLGNIRLFIAGTEVTITPDDDGNFTTNGTGNDGKIKWTMTSAGIDIEIPNLVGLLTDGQQLSTIGTVEVVYDAELNDNADIVEAPGANQATENKNTVNLEYSNNPNTTQEGNPGNDTGETPDDSVWVFTYEVPTLKTGEGADAAGLSGAKFKLSDKDGTDMKFTLKGTEYYYDPVNGTTELVSQSGGTFNIVGLDAGTYTLTETDAPNGYNTAAPVEVKITATHSEDTEGKVTMTLSANSTNTEKVEINDQKGASLPSTGGIGTTLFYLGGGALVAVAGVMLITKKRMTKE